MVLWIFVLILFIGYAAVGLAGIWTLIDYLWISKLYRIECGYDHETSTTVLAHSKKQALRKLMRAHPGCTVYSIKRIDI